MLSTMEIMMASENEGSGCLGCVVAIILIWILVFGVTIGGKHYGLGGCSSNEGIKLDESHEDYHSR